MFPKFIIVITKHVNATGIIPEQNVVLETRPADTLEVAQQVLAERRSYQRDRNITTTAFGPGATTVQGAIFIQQSDIPATS